jgi:type IV secretion system protein TrbD
MTASGIDGYEAPIHAALVSPVLLAGAPRGLTILIGTLAAALGLGLQQWLPGLGLWIAGQSFAVVATRRDPGFAAVLLRHLRLPGHLAC